MVFPNPGVVFLIAGVLLIIIFGGLTIKRKKTLPEKGQKNLSGNLVKQIKNVSDRIPEKLFTMMQEKGVSLVYEMVRIWPELSSIKKGQLWDFWQREGYIDSLIKDLGAKNEERCVEAARVLMVINDKKLIPPLINALASPKQYVPARVAEVLLSFGTDAVEPIIRKLPELSDEAKCLAISILEELGDPKAAPGLLGELSHPLPQVRKITVEALGEMGNREVLDNLILMMEDIDWGVRSSTAKALGKINSPRAIPVLQRALQDEAWWVRANAEEALKRINLAGEANNQ